MAFSDVGALICDDIDTQACQLIQAQRSDMCNSTIADTTCPRFCGKCGMISFIKFNVDSNRLINMYK